MGTIASAVTGSCPLKEEIEVVGCDEADGDCMESGIDPGAFEAVLAQRRLQLVMKRIMDVIGALVLISVFSPILLVTAVLVRFSSPGPVIFRQERRGYRERLFQFLKFRSMIVDQDRVMDNRKVKELQDSGILVKVRRDPRVTAVGAFIRRTSIDEMPQLINVLMGDMSLVGPRPLVPYMLEPFPEFQKVRCMVRPGLTGLWQIRDRERNTSAKYMVKHDLEYILRIGVLLDIWILLATLPATILGKGAH